MHTECFYRNHATDEVYSLSTAFTGAAMVSLVPLQHVAVVRRSVRRVHLNIH
jgi:hypothetical protein